MYALKASQPAGAADPPDALGAAADDELPPLGVEDVLLEAFGLLLEHAASIATAAIADPTVTRRRRREP
jgi:hypothetical protein